MPDLNDNPTGSFDVSAFEDAVDQMAEQEQPTAEEEGDQEAQPQESEAEESPEEEPEDGEDTSTDEDAEDEDGGDSEKFESLDQLIEATGMESEDFLNSVKAKVKVNGQEIEVPLSEALAGYQKDSDYRHKTSELSEARKALDSERQQVSSNLQQANQTLQSLYQMAQQGRPSNEELERLADEDPGEYQRITARINRQDQQLQQAWQNVQNQQAQYIQQRVPGENQQLAQALPEYADTNKRSEFVNELTGYLQKQGFAPDELAGGLMDQYGNTMDHRSVLIARKAMLYDKLQESKPNVTKKVKPLPKTLKPGARRSSKEVDAETRAKKMNKLKKSGSIEDAASFFFDTL